MKRLNALSHIFGFVSAAILAVAIAPGTAFADTPESQTGSNEWSVTYTQSGSMSETYDPQGYSDQISQLQPGDDVTFTVTLRHENDTEADWYFANKIMESLEDNPDQDAVDEFGVPKNSAYTYVLSYEGPNTSRILYDSERVGGDQGEGLYDATNALEDFLYLDRLSKGQTGKVILHVTLDGETESNSYFNTLARLKLRFAVEPQQPAKTTRTTNRRVVQTGEENRLFPFYVAMVVSGTAFLALAIVGVQDRKGEREGGQR